MQRTPLYWALMPLRSYAKFSGRAPRPEFWWFHLLTIILWVVAISIDQFLPDAWLVDKGIGPFVLITIAATLVPWLAVLVRRLHDSGLSGWYALAMFLPYIGVFVLLGLAIRSGTRDTNDYGEDPYGRTSAASLVEPAVRSSARG